MGPVLTFFDSSVLAGPVLQAAPRLLGAVLEVDSPQGTVAVRLSEVEAYDGADDPASHAFRGRTPRNAVMFGPAGRLYVYFVYGMHWCCNVVCGEPGRARRRAAARRLGRRRPAGGAVAPGPPHARTSTWRAGRPGWAGALGLDRSADGVDLLSPDSPVRLRAGTPVPAGSVTAGPRVGVAVAGEVPWRFWVAGDPTVSPYRPGVRRRRNRTAVAEHPAGEPR